MPWCEQCNTRSPVEQDYMFENYDGVYYCSDECRQIARDKEEGSLDSY